MRRLLILLLACQGIVIALAGCASQANHTATLGQASAPAQPVVTVATIKQKPLAKLVSVQGAMVEKCPVAGCWFNLRDGSGIIKVDTKAAGFTVTDIPLQTSMTVTGKVVPNGQDKMIQATSLTY